MPPKRKTPLGESSTNKPSGSAVRNTKASKKSAGSSAPTSTSSKSTKQTFKYSNAATLKKGPKYLNLEWPNRYDFHKDKNQDVPKAGEILDNDWIERASDMGFGVSEDGGKLLQQLSEQAEDRDQDARGMHIYTDWNGWGITEIMENLLKDFNKDIYKKTVSPFKKWAYVEAFACYAKGEDGALTQWMGNDDGEGTAKVVDMLGVMVVTALDALAEHDLFKENSTVKNIPIVCLLLLEFMQQWAMDLDLEWAGEVVRLCDEAGIKLEASCRKQVCVTKKGIADLRKHYKQERKNLNLGQDKSKDSDYAAFVRKSADWKDAYVGKFQKNHGGSHRYDLTKWSKAEIKECTL